MSLLLTVLLSALPVQETAVELRGSGWVNSRDLSLERLKGKAVVLYFYEAG